MRAASTMPPRRGARGPRGPSPRACEVLALASPAKHPHPQPEAPSASLSCEGDTGGRANEDWWAVVRVFEPADARVVYLTPPPTRRRERRAVGRPEALAPGDVPELREIDVELEVAAVPPMVRVRALRVLGKGGEHAGLQA